MVCVVAASRVEARLADIFARLSSSEISDERECGIEIADRSRSDGFEGNMNRHLTDGNGKLGRLLPAGSSLSRAPWMRSSAGQVLVPFERRGRMRACWITVVTAVLLGLQVSGGQDLQLVGKLAAALSDAQDAYKKLEMGRQAAQDALQGKRVTTGGDWARVAEKYDKAAKGAREAPLPSQFQSKNIASVADLANCSTRAATLGKLKAYLDELTAARRHGAAAVAAINERLMEIPKAGEAVTYLMKVHEKLVAVPIYGEKFALDWIDLDAVQLSLNGLESDLKSQKARFSADLAKMDIAIANFNANLSQLTNLTCPK